MAVGILASTGQITAPKQYIFVGELALDGRVQPVKGILSICQMVAKTFPNHTLILPADNAIEATAIPKCNHRAISHLKYISNVLNETYTAPALPTLPKTPRQHSTPINHVKGQESAKRALQIALSGGHNILMIGPPGSGKSMLASTLPGLMPPLNTQDAIDCHTISSIANQSIANTPIPTWPPYRAPHHTISYAGMVGGGSSPKPGEISLAHNGILFLDELPEFKNKSWKYYANPWKTALSRLVERLKR